MEERDIRRNNRRTAFLLWGIVALFFFGLLAKYYWIMK